MCREELRAKIMVASENEQRGTALIDALLIIKSRGEVMEQFLRGIRNEVDTMRESDTPLGPLAADFLKFAVIDCIQKMEAMIDEDSDEAKSRLGDIIEREGL